MSDPAEPGQGPALPRRSRLHWGWTLGLTFLLVAGAAAVVLHSPWMQLRDIEILGAARADAAGAVAHAGVGPGAFLIWVNEGEVAAAVRRDPWVRDVRVERVFPNRLVVEVLEHTPAAWIGEGADWMLLSTTGAVVARASEPEPEPGLLVARLPWDLWRVGERPSGPEWAELVGLGEALGPDLVAACEVYSAEGDLWIAAHGFRARLGPAEDLADKGRAFAALLGTDLPDGAVIDLVAPTRPAVSVPDSQPVVEGEDGG